METDNYLEQLNLSKEELQTISQHMPQYLYEKLLTHAIIPTEEHLKVCECSKLYEKQFHDKALKINEELYYKRRLSERDDEGKILQKYKEDAITNLQWKLHSKFLCDENIRCSIEQNEIKKTLVLFAKKYDLNDPRVFVVVDSLIHQMLSAHRMQLHSNQHGILNVWYDKNDNKRLSMNPVEELKLKYDEARISAIEVLDKIMEGNKNVNMNLSNQAKEATDIFNKSFEEGHYKEI